MDEKHFIVLGKNACSYCQSAQEVLESRGISFVYKDLTNDLTFLTEAKQFYNWNSVPIILMLDKKTGESEFIGGYSDLLDTLE